MCDELVVALEKERKRLEARKKSCESQIAYMEHLSPDVGLFHGTVEYRDEMATLENISERLSCIDRLLSFGDL